MCWVRNITPWLRSTKAIVAQWKKMFFVRAFLSSNNSKIILEFLMLFDPYCFINTYTIAKISKSFFFLYIFWISSHCAMHISRVKEWIWQIALSSKTVNVLLAKKLESHSNHTNVSLWKKYEFIVQNYFYINNAYSMIKVSILSDSNKMKNYCILYSQVRK